MLLVVTVYVHVHNAPKQQRIPRIEPGVGPIICFALYNLSIILTQSRLTIVLKFNYK